MGKLEVDEVASKGENDLTPTIQCDPIGTESHSSVLSKVHRCAPVRVHVFLLTGSTIVVTDRLVGLSKASLYPSIRPHPERASPMPIIFQR